MRGSLTTLAPLVALAALVLCGAACMSPNVYREDLPINLSQADTAASPDWTDELAKKAWTEGEPGWQREQDGSTTGHAEDRKFMILIPKPKVSTKRHERDLISEMIWARERSRKK